MKKFIVTIHSKDTKLNGEDIKYAIKRTFTNLVFDVEEIVR